MDDSTELVVSSSSGGGSRCRWWSKETVALVTGANGGIGFAIVKLLAQHGLTVILTSRNIETGQKAVEVLKEQGLDVAFHQLDVTDSASITALHTWVKDEFVGLDILINNAGIGGVPSSPYKLNMEYANLLLRTNYYGAKNVTETMLPLFKTSSAGNRIINVSSMAGQLSTLVDENWKKLLSSVQTLTDKLIDDFLQDSVLKFQENLPKNISGLGVFKSDISMSSGLPFYAASKIALNCYSLMLARDLQAGKSNIQSEKIFFVNCMCPGLTSTKMSFNFGHSPEEGADTAVWLALLPVSESCPSGKFFLNRQERSIHHIQEFYDILSWFPAS